MGINTRPIIRYIRFKAILIEITWISLIFSVRTSNGQDILSYRNGTIISQNKIIKNSEVKFKLNNMDSGEAKKAFQKYRRLFVLKRVILAAETVFVFGAADYDTGVPRINITTLSVGLSAAAIDILLRKPLRKRADRFVEEYNLIVSEKRLTGH
jgi:hypothetical protein